VIAWSCGVFSGVFMMVAFGIVAGIFIISIEIAYKRHRRLKEKELELAKTAADRWRGNIEVTFTLSPSFFSISAFCFHFTVFVLADFTYLVL